MADRLHGYDVSVGYPSYFIREMAPDWLDFCIRAHGFESRRAGPSYRYLDLGCGQGFHLCVLAAANPEAEFVGIDFDPEYIAHGQELAVAAGLKNATFVQADFLDLAAAWPKELGTFDYIVLQGVLSWVSSELGSAAIQCVAHGSKPGTLASFGYNSPPGWLGGMPFRHIAHELAKRGDENAALDGAFAMFRRLKDANAQLFEQMPRFKRQFELLAAQPRGYLAHELLTDNWRPLWPSSIAKELGGVGFAYAGSGSIAEALLPSALPPELAAVVTEQPDELLRQDLQDIVIMQQFRRDIFCRKPQRSTGDADVDAEAPVYLLVAPPEGAPVHFKATFGGLTVDYAAVADILAALADGPKLVAGLMALENPARLHTRSILLSMLETQILTIGARTPGSAEICERFNFAVARAAAGGRAYHFLAAAALGSGIEVAELDLLLLDTWLTAGRSADQAALAQGVAQRLRSLGRQLRFRGGPVTDEELDSHVAQLVPRFLDQVVPQWRRLGVIT